MVPDFLYLRWLRYGWIKSQEPIEHEKARLRAHFFSSLLGQPAWRQALCEPGFLLYIFLLCVMSETLFQADLTGVTELEPGRLVQFQLFEDSSGLGAEEVIQA